MIGPRGRINLAPGKLSTGSFLAPKPPPCIAALNTNGQGEVNLTDAVYVLNFLFTGGPPPVAPFPDCGPLPVDETLECAGSKCKG